MPGREIPQETVFPNSWSFMQNPYGQVVLSVVMPNALIPALTFLHPENFMAFVDDAIAAQDRFIPPAVRNAIAVLSEYCGDEPPLGGDAGRPVQPVAPPPEREQ